MIKCAQTIPASLHSHFSRNMWLRLTVFSCLFYLPFLTNFLWGNHDWGWVKENTPLWSGVFEGRFSQLFLQTLLFNGQILPIFTLLCGILAYSGTATLLLNLWNIPRKKYIYLLLGLNLITAPYTLSWLYFAFITLSCLTWGTCIICGFWLLEKKRPIIALPFSITLFTLALGGYPPVINLIFVIFFSLVLIDISFNQSHPKIIIQKYTPYFFSICLSIALFLFIQYILKKLNLQYNTYNTAGITLNSLTNKIQITLSALIHQFLTTTSFITHTYKYIWAASVFCALIILYHQTPKHFYNLSLFFIALLGLLFSPLITLFAAENSLYVLHEPRIEFFGLLYIYIFSATILIKTPRLVIKNITLTFLTLLLIYNFNTTAYAAKIWKSGFTSETNLMERILLQIEQNPAFSSNKSYTFIQGGLLDFRSRYYPSDNTDKKDSYTLTAPYIPWHLPSKAYKFYYPTDFFAKDFDIFWRFVDINQLALTKELITYLQQNLTAWPQDNAIYIDNQTIILNLTPEGNIQAKTWINRQ